MLFIPATLRLVAASVALPHDGHRQLACSGRFLVKGAYQFFYRLTIIYALQDRQTKSLTQLVLVRQLDYLEWHEASPSDILAFVFLEYVRFETPLSSY